VLRERNRRGRDALSKLTVWYKVRLCREKERKRTWNFPSFPAQEYGSSHQPCSSLNRMADREGERREERGEGSGVVLELLFDLF
jgi:hypothetical protein